VYLAVYGQQELDVAASYNNMGSVYYSQGQYERALEYYQKSLDIKIRVVGHADHPDRGHVWVLGAMVATSYNNIGVVNLVKGDLENALHQHQRALEI